MDRKVKISVDCICDLPDFIIEQYNISVAYYYLYINGIEFADGLEVSSENILEKMRRSDDIISSFAPSTQDYRKFYKKIVKPDVDVLHICMSQYSSEGYKRAVEAASMYENIYVCDSGHISGSTGIMTIKAAQMAQQGCNITMILNEMSRMREKMRTSFLVTDVDYMHRSGKINKSLKYVCKILHARPIIRMVDGHMKSGGFVFGKPETCYFRYIKKILKTSKIDTSIMAFISVGISFDMRSKILKEVGRYKLFEKVIINNASATVSCNCGPGTFGILFAWQ